MMIPLAARQIAVDRIPRARNRNGSPHISNISAIMKLIGHAVILRRRDPVRGG